MDKALSANMSRDTMDRAIKRGAGGLEDANVEELTYEGYGPGGTAVMVECMTDNRNRTVAEVRHAFSKHGGNLGTDGSVAYLFTKRGVITFAPGCDPDVLMEAAIESGAEDVIINDDNSIDVYTIPEDFMAVKTALAAARLTTETADVVFQAAAEVDLDGEAAEKFVKLIDMLEELEDVQNVYHNANVPEAAYNEKK
ncbi:MAG: DNA-binding regulatory protein YebC/PmpR family [Gammaproteobacteria bacterium]|nr:DNA-binding regulatory protein YebC/PmpR family [Gammaproteobacteria bacterium]